MAWFRQQSQRAYNAAMRHRLAQVVIFSGACLLANKPHVQAQSAACPPPSASASDDNQPSGPKVSIAEVTFSGSLQMPISDQDQIADSIKQKDDGNSLDGLIDDAVERVKAGWQNHGYFKVQVSGEDRTLTSSPANQRIALSFRVEEGLQYTLGEITFKNNKVFSDVAALRGLFPINGGDIFSREKIATGLESLSKAYGEAGYVNFVSIPDTKFDDGKRIVDLEIDVDEGKMFHMGDVNFVGLDEPTKLELLKNFPMKRGQVYNGRLLESFLLRHASTFPDGCASSRWQDEKTGTVTATFDCRPCRID